MHGHYHGPRFPAPARKRTVHAARALPAAVAWTLARAGAERPIHGIYVEIQTDDSTAGLCRSIEEEQARPYVRFWMR